jgi:hypothetical protein
MIELLDFVLWCVQEAGVLLSVGAALAVMLGYLFALRDGKISEKEARYSRNSHRAIDIGLALMILSGIVIVGVHMSLGQAQIVFSPVFVFKWLLIIGLSCLYVAERKKPYASALTEGAIGATWLALFLVHTVHPDVSWLMLGILYAVLLAVFLAVWMIIVKLSIKQIQTAAPASALKPIVQPKAVPAMATPAPIVQKAAVLPSPPPTPKPIAAPVPAPVAPIAAKAAVPLPAKPIASSAPTPAPAAKLPVVAEAKPPAKTDEPHYSPWLPALHFMPRDEQQAKDQSHIVPLSKFSKNA